MNYSDLEKLVVEASNFWEGLDWTTDKQIKAEESAFIAKKEREEVEAAAEEAADYGRRALEAFADGKIRDAENYLHEAVSIENQYGDSPTWGPVLKEFLESLED